MPSESESLVVGFFHAMRAQAKRDRRGQPKFSASIERAIGERLAGMRDDARADWFAERDAYDRQWG